MAEASHLPVTIPQDLMLARRPARKATRRQLLRPEFATKVGAGGTAIALGGGAVFEPLPVQNDFPNPLKGSASWKR